MVDVNVIKFSSTIRHSEEERRRISQDQKQNTPPIILKNVYFKYYEIRVKRSS